MSKFLKENKEVKKGPILNKKLVREWQKKKAAEAMDINENKKEHSEIKEARYTNFRTKKKMWVSQLEKEIPKYEIIIGKINNCIMNPLNEW